MILINDVYLHSEKTDEGKKKETSHELVESVEKFPVVSANFVAF